MEESLVGKRLFGEYRATKKLDEGGMGAVYLLEQEQIDQRIAVKVLHGRAAHNDELVKRFNREAKTVSMLTHPNIIRVFIFGRTEDGLIYLAMEYVQGKSLREVLEAGPLDELRAIHLMKQTLSALAEAHELGIVHRDLKPDNILLTQYRGTDDFVKVLDFGIAKVKEPAGSNQQKLTQAGVVYGTPEYLSPEQAQALELDARTDLYSMGVILYEMITGQVPFNAPTAVAILTAHVFEQPKRPSEVAPGRVSPEMEKIILKAMAKKTSERFQSANEFLQALEAREQKLKEPGAGAAAAPPPSPRMPSGAISPPTTVAPPVAPAAAPSGDKSATMRKVLIGMIVASVLLLVVLVIGIFAILSMKAG
jgi:serine/threonine-protein kinase